MTDNIWIIGASTGIGAEMAKLYAKNNAVVAISARNGASLEQLSETMPNSIALPLDVTDYQSIVAAKDTLLAKWSKIDKVIFLAGVYQPMSFESIDLEYAKHTIAVNLMGAINVITALLPTLIKYKSQLAICASIAGCRGLHNSQPYSASKAALINLTESLKLEHGEQIDVRLINPGFVKTRLTAKNNFKMPAIISAAKAASLIVQGLERKQFMITFPYWLYFILKYLPLPLIKILVK